MAVTFETPEGAKSDLSQQKVIVQDDLDAMEEDKIEDDDVASLDIPLPKVRQTKVIRTTNNNNHLIDRMMELEKMETRTDILDASDGPEDTHTYQVTIIDHCDHGTHTLEHKLKLKGEPITKPESVANVSRSLIIQIMMTIVFCMLEFVTGVVCSSIAMLADSYHMAADVMALIVAFTCIKIATRPSTRHGYGWVRAETLGGFFNGVFMITVCTLVLQEAVGRLLNVHMIAHPLQVFLIGGVGLMINVYGMFNLDGHGHSHGGGGHGHSHGGGHGHSHGGKNKNSRHGHSHEDGHGHGHGHAHNADSDQCDDNHGHDEVHESGEDGNAQSSSGQGTSEATTRLLQEDEIEEIVERRLSGVTNQNAIIATVERGITPYATHLASEVLNSSQANIDEEEEPEKKKRMNVNIRGVWLHLLSDALGSVIVMVSAGFVYFMPQWKFAVYLDPLLSMCLAVIMGVTAIVLVKTSGEKLLKQTPKDLDLEKVKEDLCSIVGVSKVDKLSVWTLSGERIIAAVHVNVCHPAIFSAASYKIKKYFHDIGVHSTTIEPTFVDTCMQSMTVMVKKVQNGVSIEEPTTVSTSDEVTPGPSNSAAAPTSSN